jgi:peptidoglycan/LPS O-acetylase OafA/YrhL
MTPNPPAPSSAIASGFSQNEMRPPHMPTLDGVRALAILSVALLHFSTVFDEAPYHWTGLSHALFKVLQFGWFGVDLFFALSGFLITGILLDAKGSSHYFSRFYWRRALRIFPIYYVFLFFIFGVLSRLVHPNPWANVNPMWYLAYLSNWAPGHGAGDKLIGHAWSLSIEEQFYLIWPSVVLFLDRRRLTWLSCCLAVVALAIRVVMFVSGASAEAIYRVSPARMDALVVGALMAICLRDDRLREQVHRASKYVGLSCAVLYLSVVWADRSADSSFPLMETAGFSVLAIGFSIAIFQAAQLNSGTINRFLRWRPLRSVGRYSYTMYLIHIPLHRILYVPVKIHLRGHSDATIWCANLIYLMFITTLVYGVARLSWVVLEHPVLNYRDRFPVPRESDWAIKS